MFASTFHVDGGSAAGVLVVAAIVGSVVAVVVDKRRRDLVSLYKGLYEGKRAEVDELDERISALEAKVDLLTSSFVDKIAEGVSKAVASIARERRHFDGPENR